MRSIARKLLLVPVLAAALWLLPVGSSADCTKVRGTVTCTTFEGPGNNQAGVGETTITTTQGNTTNFSPTPQGTGVTSTCKPPKSQGVC